MEFACRMMLETDEQLSQVALAAGMADQSHFCRLFRKWIGQSPSAWRRAHHQGPYASTLSGSQHAVEVR
jgi:AraC-like DNA-binding protein